MNAVIEIPSEILSRIDLNATDKILYGYLYSGNDEIYEVIARELGMALPTVTNSMKRLRLAGLIHSQKTSRHVLNTAKTAL